MKYDKKNIFKKAWSYVKDYDMAISEALRLSWKEAKEPAVLRVLNFNNWNVGDNVSYNGKSWKVISLSGFESEGQRNAKGVARKEITTFAKIQEV